MPSENIEQRSTSGVPCPNVGRHNFSIQIHPLFQNTVDKLVQRANASLLIGTSSWKEQFIEAITVSAGKSLHPPSCNCNNRKVVFSFEFLLCVILLYNLML